MQNKQVLQLFGAALSLPVIWYIVSIMYVADPVAQKQRHCETMTGALAYDLARIEIYYRDDGRSYTDFNFENESQIKQQIGVYRSELVLDTSQVWHPVDIYYWAADSISKVSVLCSSEETERYAKLVDETASRHPELTSTRSDFIEDWTY